MTRLPDFLVDLAREAAGAGMEVRSCGGIVRNETVGGIHPGAVGLAVIMGAMLVPSAGEILEFLNASTCVPGTGHLSRIFALIGRARTIGGMHTGDNSKRLNAERLLTLENT